MPLGRGILRILTLLLLGVFGFICLSFSLNSRGQCLVTFEEAHDEGIMGGWRPTLGKVKVNVYVSFDEGC